MFAAASLVAGVASSASAATAGTASSTHHPNVIDLACSSPLTLYDGTSLSGASVSISTRGLWINLSTVSFDNRTSSFAVGACAIDLASGTNGGGSRYPRCLSAGCVENSMASGWNNVVSSAFLH
jgi:hypothetical protein